jgi:DNA-binding SARP family transcriptional activator
MDFVTRARYQEARSYLRLGELAEASGRPELDVVWLYSRALTLLCELRTADESFSRCLHALARMDSTLSRAAPADRCEPAPQPCAPDRLGLEVYAFGPLRVRRGEFALTGPGWRGGRTLELFALLVSAGQRPIPLETTIECLWPEVTPVSGRAALKATLHRLRHRLEPTLAAGERSSYVVLEGGLLSLNPERCWTDVAQFDAAIGESRQHQRNARPDLACRHFRRAAELYTASLLSEERYREWLAEPRQQRQTQVLAALSALAEWAEQRQELAEAAHWYERCLQIERCAETAAQRLISIQLRRGRRVEAIRTFLALRQALAAELDLAPSAETFGLFDGVRP